MSGNSSEREPLLLPRLSEETPPQIDTAAEDNTITDRPGESPDDIPQAKRQLGLISAIFLIFNRIIGTGIFATPSVILRSAGSVGLALCLWLFGAAVAASGTAVFIEFGTGLPRNGGEKNYLDFVYKRPRFLATCVYSMYAVLIGWASANCLVFGEYVIHACGLSPTTYNVRIVAFSCITFCFIIHGAFMQWGLRLQNLLGFSNFFILTGIIIIGLFHLAGVPGFELQEGVDVPHNFTWSTFWEGSGNGATAFVTGLYTVIWSFIGYNNANYALSEIHDPVRTIKIAAPLALSSVTVIYLLVNIAYFAVVSKNDILGSGRIAGALFFRNLFGPSTERLLSLIIALSAMGNNLAVLFTHGRVVQELAREGILPSSAFFASSKPFNTPAAGLFVQWLVCSVFIIAPPPGDAYLFMLNLSSYPLCLINASLSGGLLLLQSRKEELLDWNPPFRAYKTAVWFFFLSNVLLVTVPLVPPAENYQVYENLPYFLHAFVSLIIGLLGVVYWYLKWVLIPRRYGYRLERRRVVQEDGMSRNVFIKVSQ